MFARANAYHSQIAYVTNDLQRAMKIWDECHGVGSFYVFSNDMPGVECSPPFRMTVALANVGGVEIELIEPVADQAPLHAEGLPQNGGFAMRFHHVAMRIRGELQDFEAHMASLDKTAHPVVWTGGMGEVMRYAYTDERATLGHYVEHVWFDDAFHAQLASAIPNWP